MWYVLVWLQLGSSQPRPPDTRQYPPRRLRSTKAQVRPTAGGYAAAPWQRSRQTYYNGDIQACHVCAVGKSKQQAHPKQATYDVQHAFQLVTVDIVGPNKPEAFGGYSYVTKFVDQHTKWKDNLSHEDETAST